MELTDRIAATLAEFEQVSTPELQALYQECFHETCRRRDRMRFKLQGFLRRYGVSPAGSPASLSTSAEPMSKSDNFRFKPAFKSKKALVHVGGTRYVEASSLTDADVPQLRDAGYGHFIETIPGRENEAEAALKRLAIAVEANDQTTELPSLNVNKADVQGIYRQELGKEPAAELTLEQLRAEITKHRTTSK